MGQPLDDRVWMSVVLKPLAEKVPTVLELEVELRKYLKGEAEFFFPVAVGDENKCLSDARILIDGYVFVKALSDAFITYNMSESAFFEGVLTQDEQPCQIPVDDIERMRAQVEKLHVRGLVMGTKVKVIEGSYRNLFGIIKQINPESKQAVVEISLISKTFEAKVPVSFLEEEKAPVV